jgi:hypothetical protein
MVEIIENEPLIKHISEFDIILVGTNCYQVMTNGFQYEIKHKYPYVQDMNDSTKYGDISKVGTFVECKEKGNPLIVLGFISFGYNFKGDNKEYIDYKGLISILKLLNIMYKGKSMATTVIGSTPFDGNGDKNKIISIINKYAKDMNVSLFDYKQETGKRMKKKEFLNGRKHNVKKTKK